MEIHTHIYIYIYIHTNIYSIHIFIYSLKPVPGATVATTFNLHGAAPAFKRLRSSFKLHLKNMTFSEAQKSGKLLSWALQSDPIEVTNRVIRGSVSCSSHLCRGSVFERPSSEFISFSKSQDCHRLPKVTWKAFPELRQLSCQNHALCKYFSKIWAAFRCQGAKLNKST